MFEAMTKRAAALAEARAETRVRDLANRLGETLPRGVSAHDEKAGVVLSGKNLRRRLVLDSRLNRLIAGIFR